MNKIEVTITGRGQGIGKTQLAEYLVDTLENWKPRGIGAPEIVIIDGEHIHTIKNENKE